MKKSLAILAPTLTGIGGAIVTDLDAFAKARQEVRRLTSGAGSKVSVGE